MGSQHGTGIFVKDTTAKDPQPYECFLCGKKAGKSPMFFHIHNDSYEVLDPKSPGVMQGEFTLPAFPIGPECRKKYPGIEAYAVPNPYGAM